MTVSSTITKNLHNCNGIATQFNYGFKIATSDELKGILIDPAGDEAALVGYTVYGVGENTGGYIITDTVYGKDYKIILYHEPSYLQGTSFSNSGRFDPVRHENAYDRLHMIAIAMKGVLDRCIKIPLSSSDTPENLLSSITTSAATCVTKAAEALASAAAALGYKDDAEEAAEAAEAARSLSEEWATKTDAPVSGGEYSAKYYAQQAAIQVDGAVKVSANDALAGTLEDKLIVGDGLALSTQNEGADETRAINIDIAALDALDPPAGTESLIVQDPNDSNALKRLTTQAIANLTPPSLGPARGLIASNAADADHDVTISAGTIADSTFSSMLTLASPITKQIDVAFAEGDDAGGLFSGTVANLTWYHYFLIEKDSNGTIDAGFDTSLTAANRPAGYTKYRRVCSVLTGPTANILPFVHKNNEFFWKDPPLDFNASVSAKATATLSVPTGISPKAILNVFLTGSTAIGYVYSTDINDEAPSTSAAPIGNVGGSGGKQIEVYANAASQIYAISASVETMRIATIGWHDDRSI